MYRLILSLVLTVLLIVILSSLRFISLLPQYNKPVPKDGKAHTRLLVVLGSGGHTAEMLSVLRGFQFEKYHERTYVLSSGDNFSATKASEFEDQLRQRAEDSGLAYGTFNIAVVPRARRIHQSLLTTPISALACLYACFSILRGEKGYPDLIMTNGPGTSVIVVLTAYVIRFLGLKGSQGKMRSIYIESWARVRHLSLSGKILLPLVNRFFVQWQSLLPATRGRGEHLGFLID